MKSNLNEDILRFKKLMGIINETKSEKIIESNGQGESYDAVLVGGLDNRPTDYSISQQVNLLKKGFGSDKNIKSFRYSTPTSEVLDFLSKNPKLPIFLFSAGCTKADDLANSKFVDKTKLFIIEPYAASSRTKNIVNSAVSSGVPSKNVFVGGSSGRGMGIISNPSSSNSSSHFGALTTVGSMFSGLKNIESKLSDYVDSGETESKPQDVKKFQTWLDQNYAGWHRKYSTLDDNIDRGWGIFGPNTKRAWRNSDIRQHYLKYNQ